MSKTPFVNQIAKNDESLKQLGLIAKYSHQAPSGLLEIEDPLTAFALNAAVGSVMLEWENRRDYLRLKWLIQSLYAMVFAWFGKKYEPPKEDDADGSEIPEDELV